MNRSKLACSPPNPQWSPPMTSLFPHCTVVLALATVFATWISGRCFAQDITHVADREAARRQAALPQGAAALARGKAAMTARNFAVAHEEFRLAVSLLPDAVIGGKAHDEAVSGFCASGIKLAEQRIAEAKFAEAEAICREMLGDRYDPSFRPAAELLARLHSLATSIERWGQSFSRRWRK